MEGIWGLGSKHIPGCTVRICNGGGMGGGGVRE